MIGSFITRAIIMVSGYVYPAYECFKSVEKNRPDVEQLQFWCQYWIIIAVLTMLERVGDSFISWLPMYCEAKLAFIIYLWYPKTKGTTYVYSTFLKPFVANHEREIDRHLNELRTRAGDLAFQYWQRGSLYAQSRMLELFQYIASQSPATPAPQGSVNSQKPPPVAHQDIHSGYHAQPLTSEVRQPSAPVLPTSYEPRSPPAAAGGRQQSHPFDFEVMDANELASAPEPPVVNLPVQRTRSRSRSRSRTSQ